MNFIINIELRIDACHYSQNINKVVDSGNGYVLSKDMDDARCINIFQLGVTLKGGWEAALDDLI